MVRGGIEPPKRGVGDDSAIAVPSLSSVLSRLHNSVLVLVAISTIAITVQILNGSIPAVIGKTETKLTLYIFISPSEVVGLEPTVRFPVRLISNHASLSRLKDQPGSVHCPETGEAKTYAIVRTCAARNASKIQKSDNKPITALFCLSF
jgi:hypothetical protein